MKKLNLDDWITLQRRRKWRWVARLANTEAEAWTTQALRWDPTLDTQHNTRRRQGRPKTRWTDDIHHYLQHARELTTYTHDQTDNNANSDDFIRADTTNTDVDANIMLQTARLVVGDGRRFHGEIMKIPLVNTQF